MVNSIHHLFRSFARIPVPNHYKCIVWKCLYNGLPTAARLHKNQPCGCGTGASSPNRYHHYYQCPRAIAAMELCRRNIYKRTYISECQATPTMIASLCADAEDTFWRVLEETCRAAGHRLRFRSLSPSFIRYVAELDLWVPMRVE
jgi:hypothetical protein